MGSADGLIAVEAITGGRNVPSSRFRVRQHIDRLLLRGIRVHESIPALDKFAPVPFADSESVPNRIATAIWAGAKLATRTPGIVRSWHTDISWLQRELLPGRATLEPLVGRPCVFDVDDAIWLLPPAGARAAALAAARSRIVLAGNEYIADWFAPHAEVVVVPTAVDTQRYMPAVDRVSSRFVVGWTGTSANFRYLEMVEGALSRFLRADREAELLVVADVAPTLPQLPAGQLRFVQWTAETEASLIREMDVGLMPVVDEPWARGKCAFKILQYMASGIPSVASPVGVNAAILGGGTIGLPATTDDEWYEALVSLRTDHAMCGRIGAAAREKAVALYSADVIADQLAAVFRSIVG